MPQTRKKMRIISSLCRFTLACVCLSALFTQFPALAQPPAARSSAPVVPFVGCRADGQAGPKKAPTDSARRLPIPKDAANRLAYYQSAVGPGVLAPRGWHCFELYGSGGGALFVSPQPMNSRELFSGAWSGFTGPIVELGTYLGDTSGRYTVATIIARVFPAYRHFVRQVVNEGIEPASFFPVGPYPADKLTYKSKSVVEYETPAQSEGLGTFNRVRKNANPIRGVAILADSPVPPDLPDSLLLSARLPPKLRSLVSLMIHQVENETTKAK